MKSLGFILIGILILAVSLRHECGKKLTKTKKIYTLFAIAALSAHCNSIVCEFCALHPVLHMNYAVKTPLG
ncbi:hypothetical protein TW80_09550 [Loktanella sp. S4079]|nr:hypothetical protein TW80_09550 [Loktanella sp. S4079]